MEGKGEKTWKNGDKYIGEFKNDEINGYGTYFYRKANQFKGIIEDGKRVGERIRFEAQTNEWRKGFWENGLLKKWIK